MKKALLSLAVASFGLAVTGNAQVLLTENFESITTPALPAGWVNASAGTTMPIGWQTGTSAGATWGTLTGAYNMPAHTKYVYIDDAVNTNNDYDTLKSPVFSMTGTSIWLNFDYFFYKAIHTASGKAERAFILGSVNGGTTWTIIDSVNGDAWNTGGAWSTDHVNLSATSLTGSNCKIAFTYTDGVGGSILGIGIDNFEVINLFANDGAITQLGYNNINNGISANGETVSFILQNRGVPITTFDAYYTINGGTPVVQTFGSLSMAPYTSQVFTFTTPMAGLATGSNTLRVGIPMVNGGANAEPVDTFKTSTFTKASATAQRQGLIEEFSSSTCPPCKSFNQYYDPLCTTLNANTLGSNFNIIKYQMNWPSPGTDRSYNADGNTRKTFYGVNSIPDHFVNGQPSTVGYSIPFTTTNTADFTTEAGNSHLLKSFIDMTAVYTIDTTKKKMNVTLTVTPHFTKTGSYHVYIATMDKNYQNTTNTTGQLDYQHVMRKMLPSGSGRAITSWTDGVAQTFTDTGIAYTNGNWTAGSSTYPVQNSYTFWSSPLGGEMIAFVEEDGNKSVMQSVLAVPTLIGLSVSTMSKVNEIAVYPNPAKDEAKLTFNLGESGNVHVKLLDYSGRQVAEIANQNMNMGMQIVTIPTTNLASGDYLVVITTDGGTNIGRLSVLK